MKKVEIMSCKEHEKHHHGPPPKDAVGPRVSFLAKLMRQAFNEAVAEQGLFSGQQDIVLVLADNEGITLSELAKIVDISTASASVSIKRMEKAGFVYKEPDENDARIIRLYPTQKAKQAPENIRKKMDSLESVLKKGMTKQQGEELAELLEVAIQNILERGEKE
jgi:DNA-binding MarR family transcriptional regulator